MTFDQIETFIMVADRGSFKAAADVLKRSQPALSIAVKKLEDELGIKLFDRNQYRPKMTTNGKAFYNRAKDFFHQGKSLEKFAKQLGMGNEAELSISIDGLVPLNAITPNLGAFSLEHPDTRINLSFDILGGGMEKVQEGTVSMAITPQFTNVPEGLISILMGNVSMTPYISKNLYEMVLEGNTSPNVMKNIPQILVRDSSSKPLDFELGVLNSSRSWSVGDAHTKKELILASLGWGRLPDHLVKEDLDKEKLVEITVGDINRIDVDIFLVANNSRPMGPMSNVLFDILSQQKL